MRISDWSSDVCSSDLLELDYQPALCKNHAVSFAGLLWIGVCFLLEVVHVWRKRILECAGGRRNDEGECLQGIEYTTCGDVPRSRRRYRHALGFDRGTHTLKQNHPPTGGPAAHTRE